MSVNLWKDNELTFLAGGGSLSGWVGTSEEYEAQKDKITDGTVVYITDDTDAKSVPTILDTAAEVLSNTTDQVIAGAEAIKELQTYSTDEMVIGTWIDSKPIYRKVIAVSFDHTNGTQEDTVLDTISDMDACLNIYGGIIAGSSGVYLPISFITPGTPANGLTAFVRSTGEVTIRTGSAIATQSFTSRIVVEYTKTTD